MNKLVSILLPVYNGQNYLIEFLDSVYHQTYRPIKLIISDDASTDDSVNMIKLWIQNKINQDFDILLLQNKNNMGLTSNINSMVHYIEGAFVFLADQDDEWNKDKVERQVDYLEKNEDCFLCFCDRTIMNENGIILKKSEAQYLNRIFFKRDDRQVLHNIAMYSSNRMVFRNKQLDKLFPIPSKICEHDIFITIMGAHLGKVGYLNQTLLKYRIHTNSVSQNYFVETTVNFVKCYYGYVKLFKKVNYCSNTDKYYIRKMLKKRFGKVVSEDLPVFRKTVQHIYLKSARNTIEAILTGKLNCFYKSNTKGRKV